MIAALRMKLAVLVNRISRRKGPSIQDQCAKVIMRTCALQLERGEVKELAPTTGATGPMVLSGGAITTVTYYVFDKDADKIDKTIRQEPWRAFSKVTMRITVERDPEFLVEIDSKEVDARALHKAPGLELIANLSTYFPLLPKVYLGPVFKPQVLT